MSITELIEEAERLDKEATPGPWDRVVSFNVLAGAKNHLGKIENHAAKPLTSDADYDLASRSRTLLPLLVAVIKNQQRQIEMLSGTVIDYSALNLLAAELEDVKP